MNTLADALALALQHHHAGNLRQAEQLYQQILHADPHHADVHHLLGLIAYQMGRHETAVTSIRQAVALNSSVALYYHNLGAAHEALGQKNDALTCFQQALRLQPSSAEYHLAAANVLRSMGQHTQTEWYARQALALRPDYPEAHNTLGAALFQQGKCDEARQHYQRAVQLNPRYAEAHNNLALALAEQGELDEACGHFRQAIQLQPNYAQAHNNLGNVILRQGNVDEAVRCFQQAVALKPAFAEAHHNLGTALRELEQLQEAIACHEHALRLQPNYAEAHWNRALLWLLLGDFERGWPEYEWGQMPRGLHRRSFPQPRWDGSALNGRTILLHAEQGLGDTLQFIRYASLVQQRGGKVIVECQPALARVLARAPGVDQLIVQGAPRPAFDCQLPLLSLPGIFYTSLDTIPAAIPYLEADPDLVAHWRQELEPLRGLRIGIAWQGNPVYPGDRQRSMPLASFAPLARLPEVHLVSVQKGPGTDQLEAFAQQFPILDLDTRLDETAGPFMDTAAIMRNLDLVISSDTAIPHLAGALGVPVWVALPKVPDWRWLLQREDSPWYPTMRLFRQTQFGRWDDVFERMASEIVTHHNDGSFPCHH